MQANATRWSPAANGPARLCGAVGLAGLAGAVVGWLWDWPLAAVAGVTALACALWRWGLDLRRRFAPAPAASAPVPTALPTPDAARPANADEAPPAKLNELDSLVEQMMAQQRHALLLRPQIARKLSDRQFHCALETLENGMALVPDGEVALESLEDLLENGGRDDEGLRPRCDRVVRVEHFFLDRYPVTNRQYALFVAAGAYGQLGLWEASIWSAVLEFVDQTGEPGPRFWCHGACESGLEDHPVVGVSWYEAAAYARWLGKRLPTDAEWVKAASWPVTFAPAGRVQHKYPWGDAMDLSRVNLWASGHGRTVAASEYAGGMSVGGVYQLIGNVWEWMRGDFHGREAVDATVHSNAPIKSIRGGAFDTYFDNQATCQFQSGEMALARRPNVGFRCAVNVCDLLLAHDAPQSEAAQSTAVADDASLGGALTAEDAFQAVSPSVEEARS